MLPVARNKSKRLVVAVPGTTTFRADVREHTVTHKYSLRATNEEGSDASRRFGGVLLSTFEGQYIF